MLTGIEGFPEHCMVPFSRISLWEGIFRLMGVDHKSRSGSSRYVLASWLVLRVVLSILT